MIYLVDYENVNLNGMVGIENLEETDHVVVFLGNNTGAIPIEWHIRILDSKAQVKYIKCGKVSKNYLDFQLATFCGYIMAGLDHEKVYVVSKDKGFDSIVDFWTDNKEGIQIARIEAIDESLGIPRPMNKEKGRNQKQKKQNNKKGSKKNKSRSEEAGVEEVVAEAAQMMETAEVEQVFAVEEVSVEDVMPESIAVETESELQEVAVEPEEREEMEVAVEPEVKEEMEVAAEPVAEMSIEETFAEEAPVEEELTVSEEAVVKEETSVEEESPAKPAKLPQKSKKKAQKEPQPEKINKLSESTKKHIRQKIKDEQLNGGNYKTIYNIFMTQSAKNRFNTALVKAFQQEQGNRIYKKLLSEFDAHIKSQE